MSDTKPKRKLSPQLAAYNVARDAAKASGASSFTYDGKTYMKENGRYVKEGNVGRKKSGRKKSGRKKSPAKKKKSHKKPPCKDNKIRNPQTGPGSRCRPGPKTKCNKPMHVRRKVSDGAKAGKWVCSPKKKRKRSKSPRKKSPKAKGFIGDMRRNKGEGYVGLGAFGIAGGRKRSRRRSRRR